MGGQLEPGRMTDRALWDRAYILIGWAMPAMSQGPSDQKLVLEQLEAVLDEIQLRGQQLELFTAQIPGPPDETTRGIRGH